MSVATAEQQFRELIADKRKFIEALFVIEDKQRHRVPFKYNPIQVIANDTETGWDIWLKPSQAGFSSERIANRLVDTVTMPGTNTVLIAYEDFITERLLSKVNFYYNHLHSLNIPGFPILDSDSKYEKTFKFKVNGETVSSSSMYIASARSYVAGRAETIHHLLADEFAFWPLGSTERILLPAIARIPPDGTCDVISTPNGESNDYHEMYKLAKEGKSAFTPHFFPWWLLPEYVIELGDPRIKKYSYQMGDTALPEFKLSSDEAKLMLNHGLTYSQIRWRRWKILQMESLKRTGETRTLFGQEFPEDDVTCFLATGDMYFDAQQVNKMAQGCYPAPHTLENLQIWFPPEKDKQYMICIDPGQAKISQTALGVICFDQDSHGNKIPKWCARDAGLYSPEITAKKAIRYSDHYNRAIIAWEANSHGLAITELLKNRRPIYFRKEIITGRSTMEPGWLTTSKTKDMMLQKLHRYLPDFICHDIEIAQQMRNHRLVGDKVEVVGANDILMSCAIGLSCFDGKVIKTGFMGTSGWTW